LASRRAERPSTLHHHVCWAAAEDSRTRTSPPMTLAAARADLARLGATAEELDQRRMRDVGPERRHDWVVACPCPHGPEDMRWTIAGQLPWWNRPTG
jgi:hypothetical protein